MSIDKDLDYIAAIADKIAYLGDECERLEIFLNNVSLNKKKYVQLKTGKRKILSYGVETEFMTILKMSDHFINFIKVEIACKKEQIYKLKECISLKKIDEELFKEVGIS